MEHRTLQEAVVRPTFGQRKVLPRICIVDRKPHIRSFFRNALEEFGYAIHDCEPESDLDALLDAHAPDLVIFGLSAGETAVVTAMRALADRAFCGKILVFAPRGAPEVALVQTSADELGLAMLPPLFTPFGHESLRARMAALFPMQDPPEPPVVNLAEALHAGWLELWYQPKVDARTNALRGVEALLRIRHPAWGIVSAAHFTPADGDPRLFALSEFVIGRVAHDWHSLVQHGPVEIAVNLPASFFLDADAVSFLCRAMPAHPVFDGMIIEINGTEALRSLELMKHTAKQLRMRRIAIAIDDLGSDWPSLIGLRSFPFVEIKVNRRFITGCADDNLKRTVCRRILDLADGYGARTVAEGVESRSDLLAVRDMEFDLAQGFLLGKPMPLEKFVRTLPQYPGSVPR